MSVTETHAVTNGAYFGKGHLDDSVDFGLPSGPRPAVKLRPGPPKCTEVNLMVSRPPQRNAKSPGHRGLTGTGQKQGRLKLSALAISLPVGPCSRFEAEKPTVPRDQSIALR